MRERGRRPQKLNLFPSNGDVPAVTSVQGLSPNNARMKGGGGGWAGKESVIKKVFSWGKEERRG